MAGPAIDDEAEAETALAAYLARFEPGVAAAAGEAIKRLRARLPTANAMIYDNYNALVVGFVPNQRPSDAVLSIAVYPRKFNLCFLQGAELDDPEDVTKAWGKTVRHVAMTDPEELDRPAIAALIAQALATARAPMPTAGRGRLTVKSISAKQRPRRP